jgi:rhombotarget A family protien
MAGHAYSANLIVTTTEDENGTNPDACSLREAIALISSGKLNTVNESTTDPYSNGYGGCGVNKTTRKDVPKLDDKGDPVTENGKPVLENKLVVADDQEAYAAVVELSPSETYKLSLGRIDIKKSLTIRNSQLDDINDDQGLKNPIIKVTTPNGMFKIQPDGVVISVSFDQVNLQGCNSDGTRTAPCEENGGLIISNENLTFNKMRISGGYAKNGGVIYSSSKDAKITATNVEFSDNKADQNGAVIFMSSPTMLLSSTLFRKNTLGSAADSKASVVFLSEQGSDSADLGSSRFTQVINSTFVENAAYALNLVRNMSINASTIVNNKGGVYFDSIGAANLANSIVAGNQSADCTFSARDQSYLNNSLYITGCDAAISTHLLSMKKLSNTGNELLIADANNDGICDKPPAYGLLCPMRAGASDFLAFMKPRLLSDYQSLLESPLVNKGRNLIGTTQALTCTAADQRGLARELCDIGAIELVINGDTQKNGQDIVYGETAKLDLIDVLGDGELMPAATCAQLYPNATPPNGVWQDGCLKFSKAPVKGTFTLNADNSVTYTPLTNFHGFERFSYDVTTTTSRFSDGLNDQTINIETTIVQEPPQGNFENKKVNLSGGSTGVFGLVGLIGLAWMRRRAKGVRS